MPSKGILTLLTMSQNHYEVLALSTSSPPSRYLSQQDVKVAYRQALLQHHPDKSATNISEPLKPKYSVDDITTAYKILSDSRSRSKYDQTLRLQSSERHRDTAKGYIGLETFDLDDLQYDDTNTDGVWYRNCRCGNERGYLITEHELEKEADHGEIIAGCGGCSLSLKVVFQQVQNG